MEQILTQVVGEGKGRYVRGHGKHHSRKELSSSAGQYRTEKIGHLVHENRELRKQLQKRDARMDYMEDLLVTVCGKVNIPVPSMPTSTSGADEEGSAASEVTSITF